MILTKLLSKPIIAFYKVFLEIALWGALLASLVVAYSFGLGWGLAVLIAALLGSGVLFVLMDIQRAVNAIETRVGGARPAETHPSVSNHRTPGAVRGRAE